jgi:hypothetical protein
MKSLGANCAKVWQVATFIAVRMQRILNFVDGHSLIVKLAPDWHQVIPENKKVSRR